MSGNLDADLNAALKVLYPGGAPEDSIYKDNPFLAMIKKETNFVGDSMKVTVKRNSGSNASATASTAFANTNVANFQGFSVTRGHLYSIAYIPMEDLLASQNNKGAFVSVAKDAVDGQVQDMTNTIAAQLFRSGSGSVGQVGTSGISTTALTLADSADVRNFEIGDEIALSSADGSGSLRDSGNTATITAIDRSTGTLTTDSNWTSQISGATDDDYLFKSGNHDNGATGTLHIKGLASWITTSTSPGALFGVTRTSDVVRLSGWKTSFSGSLKEGFIDMAKDGYVQTDARPDVLLLSPAKWVILAKELEADRVYPSEEKFGMFNFEALKLRTPYGSIKVVADGNCPTARAYMLTQKTWKLVSLGKAPHIQTTAGKYTYASTADAVSVRLAAYPQLVCTNPGANGVATIS